MAARRPRLAPNAIPEPFNSIRTYEDAVKAIERYQTLYTTMTYYPSLLNSREKLEIYLDKVPSIANALDLNVLSAKMLTSTLKHAGPLTLQVWCLSKTVLERVHMFMNNDPDVQFLSEHYQEYMAKDAELKPEDMYQLDRYNLATISFRKAIEAFVVDYMDVLTDPIAVSIDVGSGSIAALIAMLQDMSEKRGQRLNIKMEGAQHLPELQKVFGRNIDLDEALLLSFGKRRKKGGELVGRMFNADKVIIESKTPVYLLTTALLADKQRGGTIYQQVADHKVDYDRVTSVKNSEFFRLCLAEMQALEDAAGTGGPLSQRANIDAMFLTFFIMFKQCKLSVPNAYRLQRAIYAVGHTIKGKRGILQGLEFMAEVPGVQAFINHISSSVMIYCPPWILTIGRYQHVVGILGCCDSLDFETTIGEPAAAWPYVAGLKRDQSYGIEITSATFTMDVAACNRERRLMSDCIFQSEHMFHQFLLNRRCIFQNTNQVVGNALSVQLVSNPSINPGRPPTPPPGDTPGSGHGAKDKAKGKGKGPGKHSSQAGSSTQQRSLTKKDNEYELPPPMLIEHDAKETIWQREVRIAREAREQKIKDSVELAVLKFDELTLPTGPYKPFVETDEKFLVTDLCDSDAEVEGEDGETPLETSEPPNLDGSLADVAIAAPKGDTSVSASKQKHDQPKARPAKTKAKEPTATKTVVTKPGDNTLDM